jgi:transposase
MATQPQLGQELTQNMGRGPNMSVEIRDCIVGTIVSGCSITEAAEAHGRPVRTIHHLYKKYLQTGTTQDRPCSGRPPVLSVNQKKIIYQKACAAPKIEYSKLIEERVFVNADALLQSRLASQHDIAHSRDVVLPITSAKYIQN